jgi:hypothetical protein
MQTLAFFDAVPAIVVADPLADALGAVEGGFKGLAGRFARNDLLRVLAEMLCRRIPD